jgi:hypothetical protein
MKIAGMPNVAVLWREAGVGFIQEDRFAMTLIERTLQ